MAKEKWGLVVFISEERSGLRHKEQLQGSGNVLWRGKWSNKMRDGSVKDDPRPASGDSDAWQFAFNSPLSALVQRAQNVIYQKDACAFVDHHYSK